jgi:hypothetical protein
MPVSCSRATVKSAVTPISGWTRNSPTGTAKNRNISGKNAAQTKVQPSSVHTVAISMAMKAYCATTLTLPASASSQPAPAPASRTSPRRSGRGCTCASSARLRQISQALMGKMR